MTNYAARIDPADPESHDDGGPPGSRWNPMFNGWVFFGLVLVIVFTALGFASAERRSQSH